MGEETRKEVWLDVKFEEQNKDIGKEARVENRSEITLFWSIIILIPLF